ncbi:MAG: ATP-dependent Clp protease ATP-binding subunit [Candidatus Nomurabacteria bacterium]|jgi:ATP-dependent Clp protease ATP-binding subunit ClpC|nr:ATP-dependent Clp protease ATP-binding subunit [Candidatus Nomurabacteria bacterium]
MNPMFEFSARLTNNAMDALRHAEILARGQGGTQIGTEHLLLGILGQESSFAAQILAKQDVNFEKARVALAISAIKNSANVQIVQMSEAMKLVVRMSIELVHEFGGDVCGTEHFLYAIVSQNNSRAAKILGEMNVDIAKVVEEIESYLDSQNSEMVQNAAGTRNFRGGRGSFLNKFAINLSAKAARGELDPVIGREKEVTRMVTILSRRTKNNPVLIGEPGVGKTAIVEGLAQRIANEDVPTILQGKTVFQLDIAGMIAGTKYRGEFEERIKRVLDEVRADKNILIFIDELHLLVGAGAADGAIDAANMLKPALARGDFRMIGATTLDEYRRHVEKDSALARRLQTIVVAEPSLRDTEKIMAGLAPVYEEHHNVKLSQPIIAEAVRLSSRYITDRFLPDKAIDVIDEAAALRRVRESKQPDPEVKVYRRELTALTEKMEEAVTREDYEAAALYKMRISRLNDKLKEADKKIEAGGRITLKLNDVAEAVALITGVPVQQLRRAEITKLVSLEKHIARKIIGQNAAVKSVARAIRRSRSGLSSGRRPIGSFIFLGPTGVGKTELARVVAQEVFGSSKALIKIDMSEFSERHNTARLVGAPAGYVGYDDGGQLTEKIRRQPYSVVLFDEIEKAHPEVFNMLLQLLEDGRLTDGKGREVDFSNTIVILTSNVGSDKLAKNALGFKNSASAGENNKDLAQSALKNVMRPELINRFDDIIVFDTLTREQVGQIFDLVIEDLNVRLAAKGLAVKVEPTAKRLLTDQGFDEKFGARPLRRAIENQLEHPLSEAILKKQFRRGDVIAVATKDGKIVLKKVTE